jgi:chondroitin 4-sulfotransferase 11
MISSKYKFLYLHIPKCAGTSIEKALKNICDIKLGGYSPEVNGWEQHATYAQLIKYKIIDEDLGNSCFKFTFVRNPYDRVVSEYKWRIKRFGNFLNGPLNKTWGNFFPYDSVEDIRKNVSFADFVNKNYCYQEISYEQHMKPQIEFIHDENNTKIDFVGNFEKLQDDFNKVCDIIRMPRIELPHINKTQKDDYRKYYDSETYDIVTNMYKQDIKTFQYEF